jgi:hypothetical protein
MLLIFLIFTLYSDRLAFQCLQCFQSGKLCCSAEKQTPADSACSKLDPVLPSHQPSGFFCSQCPQRARPEIVRSLAAAETCSGRGALFARQPRPTGSVHAMSTRGRKRAAPESSSESESGSEYEPGTDEGSDSSGSGGESGASNSSSSHSGGADGDVVPPYNRRWDREPPPKLRVGQRSCDLCDWVGDIAADTPSHMYAKHGVPRGFYPAPFSCKVCGRAFHTRGQRTTHRQVRCRLLIFILYLFTVGCFDR